MPQHGFSNCRLDLALHRHFLHGLENPAGWDLDKDAPHKEPESSLLTCDFGGNEKRNEFQTNNSMLVSLHTYKMKRNLAVLI